MIEVSDGGADFWAVFRAIGDSIAEASDMLVHKLMVSEESEFQPMANLEEMPYSDAADEYDDADESEFDDGTLDLDELSIPSRSRNPPRSRPITQEARQTHQALGRRGEHLADTEKSVNRLASKMRTHREDATELRRLAAERGPAGYCSCALM